MNQCCNQDCNQGRTCPARAGQAQDPQARIAQLEALLKFADERINKMLEDQPAAAPHAVQAAAPEGLQLVPMNSTEEMARAFRAESTPALFYMTTIQCADFQERYRAMLAAAPAHHAEEVPANDVEIKVSAVMFKVAALIEKRVEAEPCAEAEADLLNFLRSTLAVTHPTQQGLDAGLTNAQIDDAFNQMPNGAAGFLKSWGYHQFARVVLAAQAKQGGV